MTGQRTLLAVLLVLLVILHGQLWFGRGNVLNVIKMSEELELQKSKNAMARVSNDRLVEEVRDLKEGLQMVEEKARLELGMVKPNEIYVQFSK
jgi:cell division protein FtsB